MCRSLIWGVQKAERWPFWGEDKLVVASPSRSIQSPLNQDIAEARDVQSGAGVRLCVLVAVLAHLITVAVLCKVFGGIGRVLPHLPPSHHTSLAEASPPVSLYQLSPRPHRVWECLTPEPPIHFNPRISQATKRSKSSPENRRKFARFYIENTISW